MMPVNRLIPSVSQPARWKELTGDAVPLEEHYYQGDYVKDIASLIVESNVAVPAEKAEAIAFMSKFASGLFWMASKTIEDFGVLFDNYFRETKLYESGEVEETLATLKDKGYAYEKDWEHSGLRQVCLKRMKTGCSSSLTVKKHISPLT